MIDFDLFWGDEEFPGVSEPQVQAWEARHQVALPAALRSALRRRDGGPVRGADVEILPLGEIESLERTRLADTHRAPD